MAIGVARFLKGVSTSVAPKGGCNACKPGDDDCEPRGDTSACKRGTATMGGALSTSQRWPSAGPSQTTSFPRTGSRTAELIVGVAKAIALSVAPRRLAHAPLPLLDVSAQRAQGLLVEALRVKHTGSREKDYGAAAACARRSRVRARARTAALLAVPRSAGRGRAPRRKMAR